MTFTEGGREENQHGKGSETCQLHTHNLLTAPPQARYFSKTKWMHTAILKYAEYICKGTSCKKGIKIYCPNNQNQWL